MRPEETPPTCRSATPARAWGESPGNGAETKRPLEQMPMRHAKLSRMPGGTGETAVLHVERANSADEDSTRSAGSPISRMPHDRRRVTANTPAHRKLAYPRLLKA